MNFPELAPLAAAFVSQADPARALQMQAYMKDRFPFYGIPSSARRELALPFLKTVRKQSPAIPESLIREMWNRPQREWQYIAIDLLQKYHKQAGPESLELYEFLITTHAWWDTVDLIAGWLVGSLFERHPELVADTTQRWMDSGNLWLRRTVLLYPLKYKDRIDWPLLQAHILELAPENEFFIRKAIGWILREYSKTAPDRVRTFVAAHPELSGLSQREALKWLERRGD
jgi:3-methyladenine DNA glycosylase AlkD